MRLTVCASDCCVARSIARMRLGDRSAALLATTALFIASAVSAHANDWTGAASSNWFLGANWAPAFVPRQTDDAIINTVSPNSTVLASPGALVGNVFVGQTATGMLTIQAGGTLINSLAVVGNLPGSQGTVTVTGAGSNWQSNSTVTVGSASTGTLTILDGGTVNSNGASVGLSVTGTGTVTVTGPSSSWINGPTGLSVGSFGTGTLTIANGAQFINILAVEDTNIGRFVGSHGTVTVTGAGSSWISTPTVNIGDRGTGTLTIADGGVVSIINGPIRIATFAGATGTLNIGAGAGNPAAAPGTLTAPSLAFGLGTGTLNFNHTSANYVFAPTISGNGTVNVLAGTTTLTGANTYTGATNVNAGTLLVNGSIAPSVLTTVNAGGTLGGSGTVGTTVINGGTLAPGNSIGTITVNGNLAFNPGSIYRVEVSPTTADRTNVTGTAALAGTVQAVPLPGSFTAKTYTILNAAGGVSSTFDSLVVPSGSGGNPHLTYDANNVFLVLEAQQLAPQLPPGLNINQGNVAQAIGAAVSAGATVPPGFDALLNIPASSLPGALTQLSGELATGSQQTTFDAMNMFLGLLTDPFIGGRGDPVAGSTGALGFAEESDGANAYAANAKARTRTEREAYAAIYRKAPVKVDPFAQRWSVWAAVYGGSQTTDGNTTVGSNNTTSRIAGGVVGADYRFSPNTIAGFALAGGGTNFSLANGLGSGRSDLFQAGAFVRHSIGPAYLTAALAYGWQDITTNRTVTIAVADQLRAKFNANAWSGRVEGGYRFVAPGLAVGITPYAAGQFTTFDLPAYAEQAVAGANTFALAYGEKSVTASRTELGLRGDKSFATQDGIFTLRGRAAWAHDFNPDRVIGATFQTLPGASFVVNGAAQAPDSALVTAAAEMKWRNGWSAAATFEGGFSNVTASYAGKGVARYTW